MNETVPDFTDEIPTEPDSEPEDAGIEHDHPDPDELLVEEDDE